jgi:hypothetical protein
MNPAGPHNLLIVTDPGAGPAVAQAIEDGQWPDLVGTVTGHNSVLLLTASSFFQKLVYQRIRHYLGTGNVVLDDPEEEEEEEEDEGEEAREQ